MPWSFIHLQSVLSSCLHSSRLLTLPVDCMVDFHGTSYRTHTSCMSEAQKYQGALYQGEKKKGKKNNNSQSIIQSQQPYVEDADDEYSGRPFVVEYPENLPAAPSPPSAVPDFDPEPVNVFDFLDETQSANASRLDLRSEPTPMVEDTPRNDRSVRFEDENNDSAMVPYNNPSAEEFPSVYETPVPAPRIKKESKSSDKKRKRLHVETQDLDTSPVRETEDALMTDAPPVLHSGLTGGLKGLLGQPQIFPPSPDYSGDAAEPDQSPGSPLKRTKHAKTSKRKVSRGESISNNLMSLITTGSLSHKHADDLPRKKKTSSKEKEKKPSSSKDKKKKKPTTTLKAIEPAAQKLLEYQKPTGGEISTQLSPEETKMVLYQARAELFMSFVNKGPESEKGCSMNKALKRYHRECESLGISHGKSGEEKELWRSLRLKRNERGEVVVFF